MFRFLFVLMQAALLVVVCAVSTSAKEVTKPPLRTHMDATKPPLHGTMKLVSSKPDHFTRTFRATGHYHVNLLDDGACKGHFSKEPSFVINMDIPREHRLDNAVVTVNAYSAVDLIIVMQDSKGRWFCNDDGGYLRNPMIERPNFDRKGEWRVWVGTYGSVPERRSTQVDPWVSIWVQNSLVRIKPPKYIPALDSEARGEWGAYTLKDRGPQFTSTSFSAGGGAKLRFEKGSCQGYVALQPSFEIVLDNQLTTNSAFDFAVYSAVSTIVVVQDPEGYWSCRDARAGERNGGSGSFRRGDQTGGTYKVWIGTIERLSGKRYGTLRPMVSLFVKNDEFKGKLPEYINPKDKKSLSKKVFLSDPLGPNDPHPVIDTKIIPSGDVEVDLSVVLPGIECRGFVSTGPVLEVVWDDGGKAGDLSFLAAEQAGIDTVMAVRDAEGMWHCDDDSYIGRNPGITTNGKSGTYQVWIGPYKGKRFEGAIPNSGDPISTIFVSRQPIQP